MTPRIPYHCSPPCGRTSGCHLCMPWLHRPMLICEPTLVTPQIVYSQPIILRPGIKWEG